MIKRLPLMALILAAGLNVATTSTAHAADDFNACVRITYEIRPDSSNYRYHYSVQNVCPHPIDIHYCFVRIEDNFLDNCGTHGSYYRRVVTINKTSKRLIKDTNPFDPLSQHKNTLKIEWQACRSGGRRRSQPGVWQGAKTCLCSGQTKVTDLQCAIPGEPVKHCAEVVVDNTVPAFFREYRFKNVCPFAISVSTHWWNVKHPNTVQWEVQKIIGETVVEPGQIALASIPVDPDIRYQWTACVCHPYRDDNLFPRCSERAVCGKRACECRPQ